MIAVVRASPDASTLHRHVFDAVMRFSGGVRAPVLLAAFVIALIIRTQGITRHFWLLGDQIRDWSIALRPILFHRGAALRTGSPRFSLIGLGARPISCRCCRETQRDANRARRSSTISPSLAATTSPLGGTKTIALREESVSMLATRHVQRKRTMRSERLPSLARTLRPSDG